jgi:pseudaminic acid cytidylyltransferase
MKNLAIIPARGGSKRIPRKNIRIFHGRPIIAYTIDVARASALFDRIIVSTDSDEVARVAREAGADVPFVRPEHLSNDQAPTIGVILHALDALEAAGQRFDNVCVLHATAPFLRAEDLRVALRELDEPGSSSSISVTDFGFPIFRALKLDAAGALEMIWPEHEQTRSNDLPAAYHDAGQFYWAPVSRLREAGHFYMKGMRPVVLPRHRVQDIDTEDDWVRAEKLYAILDREAP